MSEAEYLIRELIAGLESVIVRKTIPDDLAVSLDRIERWLHRQRYRQPQRSGHQAFDVIKGGK
jgi:hypothetical protein